MRPAIELENGRLGMEIRGEFDEGGRMAEWKCGFSMVPICGQLGRLNEITLSRDPGAVEMLR